MRILIYLLAMLSGFSAAEAASPVSTSPASVDAAVSQAYVISASIDAESGYDLPSHEAPAVVLRLPATSSIKLVALALDTPVYRHDVILT